MLMTHFLSPSLPLARDEEREGERGVVVCLGNGIRRLERDDSGMW